MTLGNDLGITSFDLVSLAYEFEEEFKAESEIDIPKDAETVGDLVEFVKNMLERY
jgi:acyl carrier protein